MKRLVGCALILAVIAAVFALEVCSGAIANDEALIALGALPDSARLDGEYWRLVSFGFLHWDLTHLLSNTVLLLIAGPMAERRAGSAWLLLAFVISSVVSGVGIHIKHLLLPGAGASVGASGGMFGLIGFAVVLAYRTPPRNPVARSALVVVAACGFLYSLLPGISVVGHVVGFAAGAALAFLRTRKAQVAVLGRPG